MNDEAHHSEIGFGDGAIESYIDYGGGSEIPFLGLVVTNADGHTATVHLARGEVRAIATWLFEQASGNERWERR